MDKSRGKVPESLMRSLGIIRANIVTDLIGKKPSGVRSCNHTFSFYKPYFYIKATAHDRICNLESLSYLASLHRYLTTRQISITDRHRETTFAMITNKYALIISRAAQRRTPCG